MMRCGNGAGAQGPDNSTGARGNSKTDRYSNVTSLELNYTQGAAHARQPSSAARTVRFACELSESQEEDGHNEREGIAADSVVL